MKTAKPLLTRIDNRLTSIFNNTRRKFGYGNRILATVWDEQYNSGRWSYLDDKEEAEHYQVICDFYAKYAAQGAALDIGCGHGLLYRHFSSQAGFNKEAYTGIDISQVAIDEARAEHPGIKFEVVDYEKEKMPGSFDAVIFNESLYYFISAAGTIRKCAQQNLKKGGVFIISIYDYPGHDKVWEKLDKVCEILEEKIIGNSRGQKWKVKVLKPIKE